MRLDWQPGDAITSTRLTTIPDTLKVASLPSEYEAVARGVRNDDDFIRELVNLGWPLRFAHAIATSIMQFFVCGDGVCHLPHGCTRHLTTSRAYSDVLWSHLNGLQA